MAVVSSEPHGPHARDMGPTFLVFLNVLFVEKEGEPCSTRRGNVDLEFCHGGGCSGASIERKKGGDDSYEFNLLFFLSVRSSSSSIVALSGASSSVLPSSSTFLMSRGVMGSHWRRRV